tara:strand:+ start:12423 stop:13538 length:1116 start_codon:yes stop_codon:yes gene_type:complete
MTKVLWLAPNFNHYKARFLNHLARDADISLYILSGTGRVGFGDKELVEDWSFDYEKIPVSKKKFGFSLKVAKALKTQFINFDWVLIPVEKKIFFIFIYALFLRFKARLKGKQVKLISYNHPLLKSGNGRVTWLDIKITKFYFKNLDRVIFYTQRSYDWAISEKLVKPEIAYWANNTIDTLEVSKNYDFSYPKKSPKHIVFIGRLIPSKKVDVTIKYFELLQERLGNDQLILDIIGDGPDAHVVKEASSKNNQIIWHGTLIEESFIAPIMKNCSLVFLPGDSGLSINHAFAYGRPYITLKSNNHGPEISYITNNEDGMILGSNNILSNINSIEELIINEEKLHKFCDNAKLKSKEISIENWLKKIKNAFLDE